MEYIKKFGILSGIVLAAAGVVCYVFERQVVAFFGVAAGLSLFVAGAYFTIFALIMRKKGNMSVSKLITGILLLVCGIYLMSHSDLMVRMTGVFIGVFAFLAGIDRFAVAWSRMRTGSGRNKNILFGLIHMIFGISMCVIPTWGVDMLVKFTGFYLIVSGIMVLVSTIKYHDL